MLIVPADVAAAPTSLPDERSLALGAIFSSTDSVAAMGVLDAEAHGMLHSLVFGEGVVNDATSIVLLRAVQGIRCGAVREAGCGAGRCKGGIGGGLQGAGCELPAVEARGPQPSCSDAARTTSPPIVQPHQPADGRDAGHGVPIVPVVVHDVAGCGCGRGPRLRLPHPPLLCQAALHRQVGGWGEVQGQGGELPTVAAGWQL